MNDTPLTPPLQGEEQDYSYSPFPYRGWKVRFFRGDDGS